MDVWVVPSVSYEQESNEWPNGYAPDFIVIFIWNHLRLNKMDINAYLTLWFRPIISKLPRCIELLPYEMFAFQVIMCLQCDSFSKTLWGKWPQPGNSVLNDTRWRNSRHLVGSDSSHCFHPDLVTVSPPPRPRWAWWLLPSGLRVLRLGLLRADGSGRLLFRLLLLLK